ncbi:hypothetical protein LCGC14_0306030 [marine sediment metagenome]|uniref:Sialidase domain-containing protein n=1 Tax=marine sediment metagenome TaxID=412755 RepID=A0A0F9TTY9_9ZZZZ
MAYTLIDTVTTPNPTIDSNQRKLVETTLGTIVLFSRVEGAVGIDIKYKISTDGGTTWSSWNAALAVGDVADNPGDFDIYIDTNNDILLTWSVSTGASIKYRKLTYSGGSWSNGTIYTVRTGNAKIPCITRRANGDIWIGANHSSTNKVWAWDSVDEGVNWVKRAETATASNPNLTDIIPKGSDIWFIVRDGAELVILKWSGSWASDVITNTLPVSNGTVNVLKVSDSEIYIATNTASGIVLYTYNGSSWDAGTAISDNVNDTQPSLGTSQTYVAIVWKDYDGSNYNVAYKTNSAGSWGAQVNLTDDAVEDTRIAAIESSASGKIYTVWTRINSYDIVFDSAIISATNQLSPIFQFAGVDRHALIPNPEFQWKSIYENKFCPNLINFEYKWDIPTINVSTSPITVYGCLYGYSIFMKDTGSAGSTILNIYAAGVLKKTVTIAAANSEYSDIYYFGMTDELKTLDELTVKVIQVAENSSLLKVNIYQMSFPFKIEPLFVGNLKDGSLVTGTDYNLIVSSADYWVIEFNQPIKSISSVEALGINTDIVSFTPTLENGLFKNSRIKINTYSALALSKFTIILQDTLGQSQSFNININHSKYASVFPPYVTSTSLTVLSILNIESYRYSFDEISWSATSSPINNTLDIDFSSQSEGNIVLYMQYSNGSIVYSESIPIAYYTSTLNSNVIFGKNVLELDYSDEVPIDKIEVYYDGNLADTINPTSFTGFDTLVKDESERTLQMSLGTVYYKNNAYAYSSSVYSLLANVAVSPYWLALFCFNTSTNSFEWVEVYSDLMGTIQNLPSYLLIIHKVFYSTYTVLDTPDIRFPGTVLFNGIDERQEPPKIAISTEGSHDVSVKVYDIAGRVLTFEGETIETLFTNYYTLVVTDALSNIIKPGQIHFETDLTYTITREDRI